jgi:hypothetical protein
MEMRRALAALTCRGATLLPFAVKPIATLPITNCQPLVRPSGPIDLSRSRQPPELRSP